MKSNELREKSVDQLQEQLIKLLKEQFEYRMKQATGQLGQTHVIKRARKDIARLKTILGEKTRGSQV
ncbi:50S ribosomal protein L29 [gamma proteobacterium HdN1]|nr:50S ribosomal protein L29 [gamma proteobacterium HdN1]